MSRASQTNRPLGLPELIAIALGAVLAGLVGNVLLDPEYVKVFAEYFLGASLIVLVMFLRMELPARSLCFELDRRKDTGGQ